MPVTDQWLTKLLLQWSDSKLKQVRRETACSCRKPKKGLDR
jgi:hypothetical protein